MATLKNLHFEAKGKREKNTWSWLISCGGGEDIDLGFFLSAANPAPDDTMIKFLQGMGFGMTPKEYNPRVHGPYDPAIYYGPSEYLHRRR